MALTTDGTQLLRSTDGRSWRTLAEVPTPSAATAPAIAVDRRGRTLLATLLSDAAGVHGTCLTSIAADGRVTGQRRLASPTAVGAEGGNPYYVRPDAAGLRDGGLVLDLRGTGNDPRSTDLIATRVRGAQTGAPC
jgi:hypothetical protein